MGIGENVSHTAVLGIHSKALCFINKLKRFEWALGKVNAISRAVHARKLKMYKYTQIMSMLEL